ncbi:MAG: disulfide bond formation protein DsbD [Burkholderiaceae bacterium]|nr:MAG: disulfide bond formation protein DsbD [Burkholderiaceae bacterium]TAM09687.1 MAG: disulfide bond formation protein DsbD [Pusillimonas sp.]
MNRQRRYWLGALTVAVVLVGGAATLTWNSLFASTDPLANSAATFTDFANSSAYVTASLTMRGQDGVVALHIGRDWHINANPASLDNLITSTVLIEHDGTQHEVQADYPPGKSSGITIDGTNILVYEDGTHILVHRLAIKAGDRVLMRAQACNNQGICLAPATIPVIEGQTS